MITTARDMFIAFLHGIQKEDAEGVPAEKFNYWINKAQEDWLTERSKQFDLEQKRLDDLYLLRTEREIGINGVRGLKGINQSYNPVQLRLLSDGSGIFQIIAERYFSISGMTFFESTNNDASSSIDDVTGEVTGGVVADVFYAIVTYSEITQPVIYKITVGGTLASTHLGTLEILTADYVDWETETGLDLDDYGVTTQTVPTDAAELKLFFGLTDYRFLVPNGYPNPKYFRLLNNLFKITYVDNEIFEDGPSNWLQADLMRADQRSDIYHNAYRYPTDEKPYYRMLGEFIEFVNETDSTPLTMKLEYLRYPVAIKYVEPLSDEEAIDCEFMHVQQKEIVDMAVRMYVEATQNPRYQTQIAEEQIKNTFE